MTTKTTDIKITEDDESKKFKLLNWLDNEICRLGKVLDDDKTIYTAFALVDGSGLAASLPKILFEFVYANNRSSAADYLHDWMVSPLGIFVVAIESIGLMAFSTLASIFSEKDENAIKKNIARLWPYVRDVLKAIKNAYKALRTMLQVLDILGTNNLSQYLLPIGLVLGLAAALNRILLRYFDKERDAIKDENKKLSAEIKLGFKKYGFDNYLTVFNRLKGDLEKTKQSKLVRSFSLLSGLYSGFVDGLYLYMGALGLCVLSAQLFPIMAALCFTYSAICLVTRVYEQYAAQQKLITDQTKIEVALYGKQVEFLYQQICEFSDKEYLTENDTAKKLPQLQEAYKKAMDDFGQSLEKLKPLLRISYIPALLNGLRDGLAVYSALNSFLFAISTIFVLASLSFPPALIITTIAIGFVLLVGFAAYALVQAYQDKKDPNKNVEAVKSYQDLKDVSEKFKQHEAFLQKQNSCREKLVECLKIQKPIGEQVDNARNLYSTPQDKTQAYAEVGRSLGASLAKGFNGVRHIGNPLLEKGADGHYHDTPVMFVLEGISVVIHSIIFGLRAIAKGFGRDEQYKNKEIKETIESPEKAVKLSGTPAVVYETPRPDDETPGGEGLITGETHPVPPPKPSHPHGFFNSLSQSNADLRRGDSSFPSNSPRTFPKAKSVSDLTALSLDAPVNFVPSVP